MAPRRQVHAGKVVDLGIESVLLPNGETVELEVVRHVGAAAVLPIKSDGNIVLVKQYRHATGGWLLEVPAGKLDAGEAPEACARRETEEEVGLRPGRLEPAGWIWSSPGFCDERIWLFIARDLEPGAQDLEFDEVLSVVEMPFDDAVAKAIDGELTDAKTVCLLLRAAGLRASKLTASE